MIAGFIKSNFNSFTIVYIPDENPSSNLSNNKCAGYSILYFSRNTKIAQSPTVLESKPKRGANFILFSTSCDNVPLVPISPCPSSVYLFIASISESLYSWRIPKAPFAQASEIIKTSALVATISS